ncbi:MAG: hypothetical protein Q4C91_18215 [Eubacteriales bacterium]|nr:hypothetical protein [Eubacteriales bacterium]
MDNIFNNSKIHIEMSRNNRKEMVYRLLVYMTLPQMMKFGQRTKENNTVSDKQGCLAAFWNKESYWEKKVYRTMKKWEARHPIIGIVLCTILGGILISLIAGIILEAIMMMI